MEHCARRKGQAEYRTIFLRRFGDDRQRDAPGNAQRSVLGLRAFLSPRAARGKSHCRKRRRRCSGEEQFRRGFSRRIPQSRRRHGGSAGQSRTTETDPVTAEARMRSKSISNPIRCTRSSGSKPARESRPPPGDLLEKWSCQYRSGVYTCAVQETVMEIPM